MSEYPEEFEEGQAFDAPGAASGVSLVLDLAGFEGPIDVLLTLAREQKLDITQISMVALADQYLAFVAEVRRRDLELAADYLVMAAWLAYMKSRLLLPDLNDGDEPTGELQRVRYRSDVYSFGTKWWPSGTLCITLYRPRSAQHRRGVHGGWYLGRLPAANRIEDDGPSAALRWCVASTMSPPWPRERWGGPCWAGK